MDHKIIVREKKTICFVSGKYNYYKEFDVFRLSSKNHNIRTLGKLIYGELLIKEIKKGSINLLPVKAQLLPKK